MKGIDIKIDAAIKCASQLPIGESKAMYETLDGSHFYIKRPTKVGKNLKRQYDVKTNLQVWVSEPNKKDFMPNHLRILLDLELKRSAKHIEKKDLLTVFDKLFYGEDPIKIINELSFPIFPPPLRSLDYDLFLTQLFFVEQNIGYQNESRFDPKYLFLQGWIRCVICGEFEIDRLIWAATRNAPPVKFTCKDNKHHKEYEPNVSPHWYLNTNSTTQKVLS